MSLWQMPSGILRRYAPNADLPSAEAEASGCRMTTASRTRSRVLRNWHARFWSGSGGSDPPADRNEPGKRGQKRGEERRVVDGSKMVVIGTPRARVAAG